MYTEFGANSIVESTFFTLQTTTVKNKGPLCDRLRLISPRAGTGARVSFALGELAWDGSVIESWVNITAETH